MTRKDFIAIAEVVNNLPLQEVDRVLVAHRLADALQPTNPRFDRDRFMDACLKGTGLPD